MSSREETTARPEYRPTYASGSLLGDYLRVGKDVYLISQNDAGAERFLDMLALVRNQDRALRIPPRSLVSFREDFRRIIATRPLAGLMRCFIARTDTEQRRVSVWLLGRCGRASDAKLIYQHARWFPLVVRREIVRSLRRLNALRECAKLAAGEDDQRLRHIANSTTRDFRRILAKWHVPDDSAIQPPSRPLELFVEIGPDAPVRPKSRDLIRRILERIRILLRGAM